MHREALWNLEKFRGILAKVIDLLPSLCSCIENHVKDEAVVSGFFPVDAGVRLVRP